MSFKLCTSIHRLVVLLFFLRRRHRIVLVRVKILIRKITSPSMAISNEKLKAVLVA